MKCERCGHVFLKPHYRLPFPGETKVKLNCPRCGHTYNEMVIEKR